MRVLILSIFVVACGSETALPNPREITTTIESSKIDNEVDFFKETLAINTNCSLSWDFMGNVVWNQLSKKQLGVCYRYVPPTKGYKNSIAVNSLYEQSFTTNPILLRAVIFHELAHCILGSDHVLDKEDIMFATIPLDISSSEFELKVNTFLNRIIDTCDK